jgi:hypothetical protein
MMILSVMSRKGPIIKQRKKATKKSRIIKERIKMKMTTLAAIINIVNKAEITIYLRTRLSTGMPLKEISEAADNWV